MLSYPYTEGQTVTYQGAVAELHDRTFKAWTCPCRRAHPVEDPRFALTLPGSRKVVAWHVRPASLTPAEA